MRNVFVIVLFFFGSFVSAQDLHWIDNDIYSVSGYQELTNEKSSAELSYIMSAEVLGSNTSVGSVSLGNFLINGGNLSSSNELNRVSLHLTSESSFSASSVLSNGYTLEISRGIGVVGGPPAGFKARAYDLGGILIGSLDVTPGTSDILSIEKTSGSTLVFKYNSSVVGSVSGAMAPQYRMAIATTTGDLTVQYGYNNLLLTGESYPAPTVTDTELNWTFVKTYDATGNGISSSVAYFDDLGRGLQSQSWDVLTGKNWAIETRYDTQGRPALSTMGAPIGAGNFNYKEAFITRLNTSDEFTSADFEGLEIPGVVGSHEGSLGHYYDNNPDDPYQDFTRRPFTSTIFDELNPGVIRAQVGGNTADINDNGVSDNLQDAFPQGYSYTMPAGQELYYAFGEDYFADNREGWFLSNGITEESVSGKMITHKAIKTVAIDVNGNEVVSFSDLEGKPMAAARSGGATMYEVVSVIGTQGYVDIHLPKNTTYGDISFLDGTSGYDVWDLRTGEQLPSVSQMKGGHIYRVEHSPQERDKTILSIDASGDIVTKTGAKGLRYKVNYYDYALNYYDQTGHLKESVQPLGFDTTALSGLNATPQHTLISSNSYNSLGQLITASSPDEGSANFVYRDDGQIRFSQNSKQLVNTEYSYTNYDSYGRPLESGICAGELPMLISSNETVTLESSISTRYTINGNDIVKNLTGWTYGFYSLESFSGPFEVSWEATVGVSNNIFVGFTRQGGDVIDGTADYALYTYYATAASNYIRPYKNGSYVAGNLGYSEAGDVMSLSRDASGTIAYKRNGEVLYTLADNVQEPLILEGQMFHLGDTVTNVQVSSISGTTTVVNPAQNFDPDPTFCLEQTFTLYDEPDQAGLDSAIGSFIDDQQRSARTQQWLAGNVSKTWTARPETNTTWYSYDVYGRVEWMVQAINGLGTKIIDYVYDDVTGVVTKVRYSGDTGEEYTHKYTYNKAVQLIKVETSYDNANFQEQASYEYYENGSLKRTNVANGLQGIDYVYNIGGALKSINHPSLEAANDPGGDADDVFGMIIDYHKRDYLRTGNGITSSGDGDDRYDGNIKGIRWGTNTTGITGPVDQKAYLYSYNPNQWLEEARFGTANNSGSVTLSPQDDYKVFGLNYDANGNILSLSRNRDMVSITGGSGQSNQMDAFTYNYAQGTNQLSHVQDGITLTNDDDGGDLKSQSTGNYVYNSIGQLVHNTQDHIDYKYNTSGLVTRIEDTDSGGNVYLDLAYDDRGHRVMKAATQYAGTTRTFYVRDASGQPIAIYNEIPNGEGSKVAISYQMEYPIYGSSRLGIDKGAVRNYEITDHLGNVRAVVQKSGSGTWVYEDDFESPPTNWISVDNPNTVSIVNGELECLFDSRQGGFFNQKVASPEISLEAGKNYELRFISTSANLPNTGAQVNVINAFGGSIGTTTVVNNGSAEEHTLRFTASGSGLHRILLSGTTVSGDSRSFYEFYIDDVVIRDISNESNSLLAYRDYYPFGMPMPSLSIESDYRYAFQGQEKDPEAGKEAFELRLWDSRIGRWLTTDPAGQYSSPYLGMGNNPISRIDPDGGFDYYRDADGNIVYDENIRGEQEFLDSGIDGVYLGITYQEITETSNTYYSIFGEVVDANTLEGRLYQKFDEAIFKYGTAYQPEGDGMVTATNFDLGIKFHSGVISSSADNLYEFNYYGGRGYYHVFGNTTAMKGRLDRGSGEFSKNSNYGYFALRDGYNVSISNSGDFKIVFIVFPTKEQYQRYNNAINYEFFGKTNPSPRTFVVKQGFGKFKN